MNSIKIRIFISLSCPAWRIYFSGVACSIPYITLISIFSLQGRSLRAVLLAGGMVLVDGNGTGTACSAMGRSQGGSAAHARGSVGRSQGGSAGHARSSVGRSQGGSACRTEACMHTVMKVVTK